MAEPPVLLTLQGLSDNERDILTRLRGKLRQKENRNRLRSHYYEGRKRLDTLGISIPPSMATIETVIGWPAKAVDVLEQRLNFQGFVLPVESELVEMLADIDAQNNMTLERSQAHISGLTHGTAFGFATIGDPSVGDPEIVISVRSARQATAIYDRRRRRLSAALEVVQGDRKSERAEILYLPDQIITLERDENGRETISRTDNPTGRVLCSPLVYRPFLEREFGMSRITRPVMSITDTAVRTMLRTEVSAEFYSSPQRWVMGADESAFQDKDGNVRTGWETILGRIWAIPQPEPDDDGLDRPELPKVGQFPAASMQPHIEMLRQVATGFAGETAIPVNYLGIIHDNPSSADAINAAEAELNKIAERAHDSFGSGWVQLGQLALMLREGTNVLRPELRQLRDRWGDPATRTRQAAAQSVMSLVSTGVYLPRSEITFEQLGLDQSTIDRLMLENRVQAAEIARLQLAQAAGGADPRARALSQRETEEEEA